MRVRLGLILWLSGLIFPLAWLGRFSSTYRRAFNLIFGREWVHILMHAVLFAVLGILLVSALKIPLNRRGLLLAVLATLGVGISQEYVQVFSQGITPYRAEVIAQASFDLITDLLGGIIGLGALHLFGAVRNHPRCWDPTPARETWPDSHN